MTSANGRDPSRRRAPRPYRDSVLVYGGFALLIVFLAVVTGGNVWWAIAAAAGAFVLAVGWTWRGIRARERQKQ